MSVIGEMCRQKTDVPQSVRLLIELSTLVLFFVLFSHHSHNTVTLSISAFLVILEFSVTYPSILIGVLTYTAINWMFLFNSAYNY